MIITSNDLELSIFKPQNTAHQVLTQPTISENALIKYQRKSTTNYKCLMIKLQTKCLSSKDKSTKGKCLMKELLQISGMDEHLNLQIH